jgi:hypothetical protein
MECDGTFAAMAGASVNFDFINKHPSEVNHRGGENSNNVRRRGRNGRNNLAEYQTGSGQEIIGA